jgi:N-acetyl-1-D-myo-inositol-2-amino-2-deoxy-alpha-D-glucopyranoside deacetylase
VLAVFAHPDDETLVSGALAEAAGREGVEVRSVTLTRGEKGYAHPPICREADLGLVRESELRRYGHLLGIDHQELWDYPDGSLADAASDPIVDRLVATIRRHAPGLVLGFDPAGGYTGHPDHKAAGALMTDAVRLAADPAYKPGLGPPHRPDRLAYVVAPRRMLRTFGDAAMREAAAVQPGPDVAIPVDTSLKGMGWEIHQSQHLGKAYGLPAWLLYDFFDKEHYVLIEPASRSADDREPRLGARGNGPGPAK